MKLVPMRILTAIAIIAIVGSVVMVAGGIIGYVTNGAFAVAAITVAFGCALVADWMFR